VFILQNLLCEDPPAPPAGVNTTVVSDDPKLTTRQKLEEQVASPGCSNCHVRFDPLGFALEHFDAIGQYREKEGGLTIDATGSLDGVTFDGVAELGGALRQNPRAIACLVKNLYRDANGRADAEADAAQIDTLRQTLVSKGYVWRDLIAEFVTSDAFRSAPLGDP
jgi:hypothetical protein